MWRRNHADQQTLRADIRRWFTTPVGERHLEIQQRVLAQLLPGYFGYHLLQLSPQSRRLYDQSPVGNQMCMGNSLEEENPSFWGDGLRLPFENDSIDVLILHHMLDFFEKPQQLLREVERVALPMGYLVILGFNPLSAWGVWRTLARFGGNVPWNAAFLSSGRMMDWLSLLNFHVDRIHYANYDLPISLNRKRPLPDFRGGLSRRFNLPLCAGYVIVARKQVSTMTSIRPAWRPVRRLPKLSVVPPVSHSTLGDY